MKIIKVTIVAFASTLLAGTSYAAEQDERLRGAKKDDIDVIIDEASSLPESKTPQPLMRYATIYTFVHFRLLFMPISLIQNTIIESSKKEQLKKFVMDALPRDSVDEESNSTATAVDEVCAHYMYIVLGYYYLLT